MFLIIFLNTVIVEIFAQYIFSSISPRPWTRVLHVRKYDVSENYNYYRTNMCAKI